MTNDSKNAKPRVIEELDSLIKQAAVERSHYYVSSVCKKAQLAIGTLMAANDRLEYDAEAALYFHDIHRVDNAQPEGRRGE